MKGHPMKPLSKDFAQKAASAFHFDKTQGKFFKIVNDAMGQPIVTNESVGLVTPGGIRLTFDGRYLMAHHLAWFIVHGSPPTHKVSHIDGDNTNNRPSNLSSPKSINDLQIKKTSDKQADAKIKLNFLASIGITESMLQDNAIEVIRKTRGEKLALDTALLYKKIDQKTYDELLPWAKYQDSKRPRVNT
jgi:hypothetical protein